jgi:hypothetical protein
MHSTKSADWMEMAIERLLGRINQRQKIENFANRRFFAFGI